MKTTMFRSRKAPRVLIATLVLAALPFLLPTVPRVHAEGLRNCVDVTGNQVGRVACYEMVWANGVQHRMTFSDQQFMGATPAHKVGNFYVLAPQTATPQGTLPFLHDHVVGTVPSQSHGDYTVHLHGYFVLCSEQGIASGGCVSTMTSIPGFGTIPFARSVNGQMLTSAEPIESAADAGLLALFDTRRVIVGTITAGE